MRRMRVWAVLLATVLATACGLGITDPDDGGNGVDAAGSIFVLHSVGQTIGRFDLEGDALVAAASPIVLPENFDGDEMQILGDGFATTISALGGSQVILGNLDSGETIVVPLAGDDAALADPSKVTLVDDPLLGIEAWVAGRGTNAIYRIGAADTEALPVILDVGEFVERVLPVGQLLYAVDANLDDDGGTFQPLGPPRVLVLSRVGGQPVATIELVGSAGATNAVFSQPELFVLAGGSFDEGFQPRGDGSLVVVDASAREVRMTLPLEGNGISLEPGRDGNLYITRTTDFQSTQVLSYSPGLGDWVRGPSDPILPQAANGDPIDCWAATALVDGRLLCVTFSVPGPGRLHLLAADGVSLSSIQAGVGATDIALR